MNAFRCFSFREIVSDLKASFSSHNLNRYLKALKIFRDLGCILPRKVARYLYYTYYSLVKHQKMFSYPKYLAEIDRTHDEVFNIKMEKIKAVRDNMFDFP